jgi:hypothetical protein
VLSTEGVQLPSDVFGREGDREEGLRTLEVDGTLESSSDKLLDALREREMYFTLLVIGRSCVAKGEGLRLILDS